MGGDADANLVLPQQAAPELFVRDAFGRAISSVRVGTYGAPDMGVEYSGIAEELAESLE